MLDLVGKNNPRKDLISLAQGRAVQVDPIKPTLKALGAEHMKPKYDDRLSNFAFNFNLRRYTKAIRRRMVI